MNNYKKLNNLVTILTNKQDFLDSCSRETHRSSRYNYPISSLTIFIPEDMATKKIEKFITDSFRGSDIIYCNYPKQYIQVLLPFTPQDHLDLIIDRVVKEYNSIKPIGIKHELICDKVNLNIKSDDIEPVISVLEKADANANVQIKFIQILRKLLTIMKNNSSDLNFINYYCGMKIHYKATLVNAKDGLYTFKTDAIQLAAIMDNSQAIIQVKRYGYEISAKVHHIDFTSNTVTLKDLFVVQHSKIYPASLAVELKETLNATLMSLSSDVNIKISAISFNEIYAYGDISNLLIDNNTLRLLIHKGNQKHTLRVRFIHSTFDGDTQKFILRNTEKSQKSIELFQDLVTQRSRECIHELKQLIA